MRCNGGSNACKKQHLTSVDIAYPHDQTPRQQHLLDGRATRLEPRFEGRILIRPCEVLSRVANVTILEVANNALRVLLQHRHVIIGSLA